MEKIKKIIYEEAPPLIAEIRQLAKEHGHKVVSDVTLSQVLTGMRGVISLLTSTSKLDPEEGIRFRGYSIPEIKKILPKAEGGSEPLPEGLFYLMLLNHVPTDEDVKELSQDWARRSEVPDYVYKIIESFPVGSHPMAQLCSAVSSMSIDSKFRLAHRQGLVKKDYWDLTYEDVMDLIGRLPRIAAYIYRRNYHNSKFIDPDPSLDWAANFAHMMGYDDEEVKKLFRLYLTIHTDHEGGNVSAHTTHLVGSTLSNPYYAYASGLAGLAGPLHGLANQEVIRWIFDMLDEIGTQTPTKQQISDFVHKTLSEGKVIPGYGHAVLRKTDPRYMAQREFALTYLPDDPLFQVVSHVYEVVPPILSSIAKIKNPWPNVDAHSGVLLLHYGIKEYDFYTALFGVSRALGVLAQLVWDRALGLSIERPKSQDLAWFKQKVGAV